jgi:hypothetical protein
MTKAHDLTQTRAALEVFFQYPHSMMARTGL